MSLYFGLPMDIKCLKEFFEENYKYSIDSDTESEMYSETDKQLVLDKVENTFEKIRLHYTDKGQYILGFELKEISVYEFTTDCDKFVTVLKDLKKNFMDEIERVGLSLERVKLYPMESEYVIKKNALPYIILFSSQ